MSVRVTLKKREAAARIIGAGKAATPIVANEFLKDANYFCREDTGELIRSSIRASKPEEGRLIWDTDYARKVYYTGKPSHDTNKHAELMWAHKARTLHGDKYQRMFEKIIKEKV